jgi:hypothetical protein
MRRMIGGFIAISVATSAMGASMEEHMLETRVAVTFLNLIDQERNLEGAYDMLDPIARSTYPYDVFSNSMASRFHASRIGSRVLFARSLARANAISKQQFIIKQAGEVTAVCFRDEPRNGWGNISYTEVLTLSRPGRDPTVLNVTFQSEPTANCQM